ncbi:ABC transporter permease subunit [Saccharopolyspora spinosa]|uniref:ABC transporter permease subunit n=1 Tax=Saccharopolyspora spinosa TaxID=60894 RepID=UPI000237A58A|nr:ABC transporter permease subunit [Saccharopolyspora spinosa]
MNGETQAQDVLKPPRVKDGRPNLEDLPTRERISIPLIVATIVTTILTAAVLVSFFTNKAVQWPIVIGYLFDGRILQGVLTTIEITAMAMALGLVIAVTVALMRLSKSKLLRTVAQAYTWLFRAMPLLVLLILTYNFALFYPEVGIGIPARPMSAFRPGRCGGQRHRRICSRPFWPRSSPSRSTRVPTPPKFCAPPSCPFLAGRRKRPSRSA